MFATVARRAEEFFGWPDDRELLAHRESGVAPAEEIERVAECELAEGRFRIVVCAIEDQGSGRYFTCRNKPGAVRLRGRGGWDGTWRGRLPAQRQRYGQDQP